MTNQYFDASTVAIDDSTRADAQDVNNVSNAVQAAFDNLPDPDEFENGNTRWGVDSGTANTYVVTSTNPLTVPYVNGTTVQFVAANANSGASTLNVDGQGAVALTYLDTTALENGAIPAGGIVEARFANGAFQFRVKDATASASQAAVSAAAAAQSALEAEASADQAATSAATLADFVAGYDLFDGVYSGRNRSTSPTFTNLPGLAFKTDGTMLFVLAKSNNSVMQFNLTEAWDLNTSVYSGTLFSVNAQEVTPETVRFSDDGLRFYIAGNANNTVYQYDMTSPWDISTAVYNGVDFDVSDQETEVEGLAFGDDGLKMYIVGKIQDAIFEYDLSTAFDIGTAVYNGNALFISGQVSDGVGLALDSDGLRVFVIDEADGVIEQYNLSTAWSISTGTYANISFDTSSESATPGDIYFSPTGANLYTATAASNTIFQYYTYFVR